MINARAETVHEKPAYRRAFRNRRCLIPANGFYEWQQLGDRKQPFYIQMADSRPFAMAGLWEHWEGPDETIDSCSIIVTDANSLIQPVHDRMPVIVAEQDYATWLDPELQDPTTLCTLLHSYPPDAMQLWPVDSRVNNPRNNGPELITPIP
jgi:putative SOS response-associated peptidase YedK